MLDSVDLLNWICVVGILIGSSLDSIRYFLSVPLTPYVSFRLRCLSATFIANQKTADHQ